MNTMTAIDAFAEGIANAETTPTIQVKYYLYHDGTKPLFFTCDLQEEGKFIEVTVQEYNECNLDEYEVDGMKLVKKELPTALPRLVPVETGGTPCHPEDITVVADSSDSIMWSIRPMEC